MNLFKKCSNMFGELSPDIIKRIKNYLDNPTIENWDDIYSIIIDGEGMTITIWKALIAYDKTFPIYGRSTDAQGNIVHEWEKIPTAWDVLKAIQMCVNHKDIVTRNLSGVI